MVEQHAAEGLCILDVIKGNFIVNTCCEVYTVQRSSDIDSNVHSKQLTLAPEARKLFSCTHLWSPGQKE